MWGNSALMSGCVQKVLSCIEVGFTSQTTLSSIMAWCMHTMELWLQDTLDDGKHWNWCCGTAGGQGCPGMSPNLSQDVMHATRQRPSLHRRWVPDQCWQLISIDMIGELPDSKGYNPVLVVVDHLSKQIHTIPSVTSLDSSGVSQLFLKHIWCHHGLLEEVISNHGPTFVSN